MSVYLYDVGLLEKLKYWTAKTNAHIYGVDESRRLFETIADETNDQSIKLPIIVLSRPSGYTVTNINKRPLTFDGMLLECDAEGTTTNLNAIPITIEYQLDVYCRYLKECDEYIRNLLFNIINHPTFEVKIPYYGKDIIHYANIRVAEDVEDNSGIPQHLIPGQFTRMSLSINIDDAYLWDTRCRPVIEMAPEFGDIQALNPNGKDFTIEQFEN